MARKTKEEFIEQANQVHHNKFDYSLGEYKNIKTKIKIICPEHGVFEQLPYDHLSGNGCRLCSGKGVALTQEYFIEQARQIHNNQYDYSLVNYTRLDNKVTIICPIHGQFNITPRAVLHSNQGCKHCGNERARLNRIKSREQFILEANQIHDNKYTYENVAYEKGQQKVNITCPFHGPFNQTPTNHIHLKQGCPTCGNLTRGGLGGYTHEYFKNNPEQQNIPGVLYCVRIQNGNENFIKIGITSRTLKERFSPTEYKNMEMDITMEKYIPLYEAFCLEQSLIEELKPYRFFSNTEFSGYTECFKNTQDVLDKIFQVFT